MGNWYVRADCRLAGAERVFRLDRIREVRDTDETFTPPESVPPPVVEYIPSEEDVHAVISLGPRSAWVAEYYPVETVEESAEGTVVRMSVSDPSVAARLLLRLGSDAELLEGEEVASTLDDLRSRIVARYAG